MKLLIAALNMQIGGIQKALLHFLKELCRRDDLEITLVLLSRDGEYLQEIPPDVRIMEADWLLKTASRSLSATVKGLNPFAIAVRLLLTVLVRVVGHDRLYDCILFTQKRFTGYDTAISYFHDSYEHYFTKGCNKLVLQRVDAAQKIAFIHTDIEKEVHDFAHMARIYSGFDRIVTVSDVGKRQFDARFPTLAGRTCTLHNLFPGEEIREKARAFIPYGREPGMTVLVTVSRLSFDKGTDRIKETSLMLSRRYQQRFRWYVVGEGTGEYSPESLRQWATENGLGDQLVFTGSQPNPYPYILHADFFVLPTRYEGYPMVVGESLILGAPVVATRYAACEEQIVGDVTGLVVDNDTPALLDALADIMGNPGRHSRWRENLRGYQPQRENLDVLFGSSGQQE